MFRKKNWSEGEMMSVFQLTKTDIPTPLMAEWLDITLPMFNVVEEEIFENLVAKSPKVATWSEGDLKMKYLSFILSLSGLTDETDTFVSYFDKRLSAKVDAYDLSVSADFVVAKGVLNYMQRPFFHFQEYKPQINPKGEPMAQLLEAFLIAQSQNDDGTPLYGCEVIGRNWSFITMEARTYCVSKSFDSTDRDDLLRIIAILRKFRYILETRLLKL